MCQSSNFPPRLPPAPCWCGFQTLSCSPLRLLTKVSAISNDFYSFGGSLNSCMIPDFSIVLVFFFFFLTPFGHLHKYMMAVFPKYLFPLPLSLPQPAILMGR